MKALAAILSTAVVLRVDVYDQEITSPVCYIFLDINIIFNNFVYDI